MLVLVGSSIGRQLMLQIRYRLPKSLGFGASKHQVTPDDGDVFLPLRVAEQARIVFSSGLDTIFLRLERGG